MLYLLSTSCVLTLASSLLFPLGYATAAQFLPTRASSLSATRTTRTSRCFVSQSTSLWRPAQLRRALFVFVLRFRCIRHFVINVINNIRIRFIMSYSWYVLWYTVHSVVYTCDLILARIWLLGLCSFINRVLQARSNLGMGDRPGSYSRVRTSEDKVCRKDLCWSVRAVYVLESCQM